VQRPHHRPASRKSGASFRFAQCVFAHRDVVARHMRQRVDMPGALDLPDDVMLIEEDVARGAESNSHFRQLWPGRFSLSTQAHGIRAGQPRLRSAACPSAPSEAVQCAADGVLITMRRSSPDSGSQTSPGRPRIWRTPAPFSEEG
jgi:hypothetical protein